MNFKFFTVICMTMILSTLSCRNDSGVDPLPGLGSNGTDEISIREAKEWFQNRFSKARSNSSKINSKEFFRYATQYSFTKKDKQKYVILPIAHESSEIPSAVNGFKQLWIYKNIHKENVVRVMEFIPDETLSKSQQEKNNPSNFTGTMVIRTWENEPLGGIIYKGGKESISCLKAKTKWSTEWLNLWFRNNL
jgi:hypothetical protein